MEKLNYDNLGEVLYKEVLDNGLTVYYLLKPDYNRTYGLFTTNFGSLDTNFNGRAYPEGIAHFLEHKLFEKEDGDAMYKFGALGAQTNAFTSFSRTSYLFSTRENAEACVELLLDFVQEPYFTAENVAKEQDIIQQEIQMYQDDSDWALFSGLLEQMYPASALAADIAGSPETIQKIAVDELYENYETFYQPSNMNLFLTGPFDIDAMSGLVRENQAKKSFPEAKKIAVEPLLAEPARPGQSREFELAMPKLAMGFRGEDALPADPKERMEYKLSIQLLLSLLFGKTSSFYEEHYNSGLIDDSFAFAFDMDARFHFASMTVDTEEPKKVEELLQVQLKSYKIKDDFNEEHLSLIKKEMIGDYFQALNSLEYIANQFASELYGDVNFFDMEAILKNLDLTTISKHAEAFTSQMQILDYTLYPKSK
ncbi:EF-P 5-aminopentanol modification-associated protein YfmH [Lactococcus termiticola]|uniref:Peptidase M16 n=1 Tax=Lactococcus termiticola TaxID=2169526 RepID=A0A2R5HJK2_9LACT|nr:pitrilysin family protein [Lactococcus termiticola]GBG96461.1 peptidase M16 [Lactococcus termiticola]